jgi:protein-tyrosine phosphatase
MSVWKLTDKVWWGNAGSPAECRDTVKSVICVAENPELVQHGYSPYLQHLSPPSPNPKPFFWLPRNDHVEVDLGYLEMLIGVLDIIDRGKLFPLLIHCFAGVHRSPAVAIYAGRFTDGDEAYNALHARARELRPEMEYHAFSLSLHRVMSGATVRLQGDAT